MWYLYILECRNGDFISGEANSFDKLTTPLANDPELAEGYPEQATSEVLSLSFHRMPYGRA
jgi:hypothetical protein